MDDQALTPSLPTPVEPEVTEQVEQDSAMVEAAKVAQAVSHPAWAGVESYIQDVIARYSSVQGVDQNLLAAEYKVEGMVRSRMVTELTNLVDRIHQSVEAVERAPRKPRAGA